MPTEDPRLKELAQMRGRRADAEAFLQQVSSDLDRFRTRLEIALKKGATGDELDSAYADFHEFEANRVAAQAEFDKAARYVDVVRAELLDDAQTFPSLPVELSSDYPIVFFPIRLETKFAGPHFSEILIRIYPDDVHIDTHESRLTDAEIELGQRFWTQAWGPQGNEAGAWNELVSRVRAPRAAWITKALEPTNVAQQKIAGTSPEFPSALRREATWTRAPRTTMLPDRWVALARLPDGHTLPPAFSELIPDWLAVGPAPQLERDRPQNPESLPPVDLLDEGMKWLVDFNEALKVGMAIRLELPLTAAREVERLIVFGVKSSMDSEASGQSLGDLFDAHHYTRSFSFIPRGVPTNNTGDAPSGYDSGDLGSERSFATERGKELFTPGNKTRGDRAAMAFGVLPETFFHVSGADGVEEIAALNLNASLWAGTWGYFLTRQLKGTLKPASLVEVRRHFIEFVRGGGPFPSLRVGRQPYGLLPVTSLYSSVPADEGDVSEDALEVLRNIGKSFERTLARTPRVNKNKPAESLIEVLRQSPTSSAFGVRHVIGPELLHNYVIFCGTFLAMDWWKAQQVLGEPRFGIPGMPDFTLQSVSVEMPYLKPLEIPLVQFPPLPTGSPLSPNYIQRLHGTTISSLRLDELLPLNVVPAHDRPLLYRILRHSLLIDYVDAAWRLAVRTQILSENAEQKRDPEPELRLGSQFPAWSPWQLLGFNVTPQQTIGAFLEDVSNDGDPDLQNLGETRKALGTLAELTTSTEQKPAALLPETLELLLRETLDTCSYRFDAWATSVATRRLHNLREANARGLYIGGYGWVENLKPNTAASASEGFIHAPSQSHATTAGILASAFLSHRNQPALDDPFIIDLSSDRVRLARQLIHGVRQGQPLGALIGYRLERKLQENPPLQVYTLHFRTIAPLAGSSPIPNIPLETVAANNVVDGVRILEMRKPGHLSFNDFWAPIKPAHHQKIKDLFDSIESDVDALGDVMMAEKVYQAARGNFSRAGYSAEDIARGQPHGQPEVIDTPRTGTAVGHRVMFFWKNDAPQPAAWSETETPPPLAVQSDLQIRAMVEPRLNALAAQLLPDPENVRCRAEFLDPQTGEPIVLAGGASSFTVVLQSLGLSPLDAIYISSSRARKDRGELEQRVEYAILRSRPAGVPPDAKVRLNYTRDMVWPAEVLSFSQFQLIAAGVRRLFAISRPLTPGDLVAATDPAGTNVATDDVADRAELVAGPLRELPASLKKVIDNEATIALEEIREVLMRCAYLGISTAIPVSAADDSADARARLGIQARSVLNDVLAGIRKLDEAESQPASPQERNLRRIRCVLGSDFQVLPRVTPGETTELSAAFNASTALQGGDASEAGTWLARLARVRQPLKSLGDVLRNTEVLMNRPISTTVAQLPFQAGDRWAALSIRDQPPLPEGRPPLAEGRVSIVACGTVTLETSQPVNAILVDEWTEVVPKERETTGVAFHFDQPGATAPQAVLLGVAPNKSLPWNLEIIEAILGETLDLCKLRTVNHNALVEMNHYLPALYFALNAEGDTVTTNFGA